MNKSLKKKTGILQKKKRADSIRRGGGETAKLETTSARRKREYRHDNQTINAGEKVPDLKD